MESLWNTSKHLGSLLRYGIFYILRWPKFSLGNAKVYINWNKLTMMSHLPGIRSQKSLRCYKYLLINYLLSINTEFVKWLLSNSTFSGWKGWESFSLLLCVGTTSPAILENGHTSSAYTFHWVIHYLLRQAGWVCIFVRRFFLR